MLFARVITIASVMALTACGTSKKKDDAATTQPSVTAEQAKAQEATLPKAVVVKVPVVNGKEQNDKAEMRLADTNSFTNENIASQFNSAKLPAVTKTKDELDQTSSTESCWLFGFGGGYGYGYAGVGSYWGSYYRPTYMYGGYSYGYGYASPYAYGGYNYYSYGYGGRYGYGYGYGY